jgi:uncharacterized protein HemY
MLRDSSPDSIPLRITQCDAQIQLRKFEAAKTLSTELYKLEPRNSEVLRVRGLSLYYTGNLELALKHFSEVGPHAFHSAPSERGARGSGAHDSCGM